MGKHLAFTVSICGKGKASELRRMMSYKRDMFIFEWGDSPYRPLCVIGEVLRYILDYTCKCLDKL